MDELSHKQRQLGLDCLTLRPRGIPSRVQMQLARQDEDLEELGTHVERVGETATVINEELRSQNR